VADGVRDQEWGGVLGLPVPWSAGVYFSSGDNGDETGGNPASAAAATRDWPASSPWVTAVGGTTPLAAVRAEYANGVDPSGGYAYTLRSLNFDSGLTIHTRPSYDDVTGVGSPNGPAFLTALAS
jgi:subtilase family serine protease